MHREEVDDRQLVVPVSGDADTTSAVMSYWAFRQNGVLKYERPPFFCDKKNHLVMTNIAMENHHV